MVKGITYIRKGTGRFPCIDEQQREKTLLSLKGDTVYVYEATKGFGQGYLYSPLLGSSGSLG